MTFAEIQFPPSISLGATGGPVFSTDIITTFAGNEQRVVNWSQARGRWNIATGLKSHADIEAVIAFFRARRGRAHAFRFKDWSDYQMVGAHVGVGDGNTTQFQLRKQYESGGVVVERIITKPVTGTLTLYVDATPLTESASVDETSGIVTFDTAPPSGAIITADGEFDVPVRFDIDQMDVTMQTHALGQWSNIPLIEIRTHDT